MKKCFLPVLALFAALSIVSCSEDGSDSASPTPSQISAIATSGVWHVSSYTDDGTDETNHFTNYNFTFGSSNVLTATNGTDTYSGIWTVTPDDDSDDDDPSGEVDFNIAFTEPADFADLTEDWDLIESSSSKIRLRHISGGNGGTDYLTFEKN